MNALTMMKRPGAFIPVVMSSMALAIVVIHIVLFGATREPDEGTAAHLFQLLMVLQVPIIVVFAVRWLVQAPKQTVGVLALQAGAALAAMAPVWFFNL